MAVFESKDQKEMAKEYATAMAIVRSEHEIQEMQRQAHMANMQAQSAAKALGAANGYGHAYNQAQLGNYGASIQGLQAGKQQSAEHFNPNKREAFQVPLSTLVTMWQVKYGDQWVHSEAPISAEDERFYIDALRRMVSADLFENHAGWVRLKENVEKILADR